MTLTLEALLLIFILVLLSMTLFTLWQNIGGLPFLLKQHHQEHLSEMKSLRSTLEALQNSLDKKFATLSDDARRLSEKEQLKLDEVKNSVDALRRSLEESIKF